MDTLVKCGTDKASRPVKTDHFPIVTQFDIYAPQAIQKPRYNFRLAEWPEPVQTLTDELNSIPAPTEIHNADTFTHTQTQYSQRKNSNRHQKTRETNETKSILKKMVVDGPRQRKEKNATNRRKIKTPSTNS